MCSIQICIIGFVLIQSIIIVNSIKRGVKVGILLLPLFFPAGTYCMSKGAKISPYVQLLEESKKTELFGTVTNITYEEKQIITVKDVYVVEDNKSWELKGCLIYLEEKIDVKIGNEIKVEGKIFPFEYPTNPGQFNMKEYYRAIHIEAGITGENVEIINHHVNVINQWLLELKIKIAEGIDSVSEQKDSGIYKGIFLGDRSQIEEKTNIIYDICGISHILSISGMHISCIGMGVYYVIRRLMGSYVIAGILSAILIVLYGYMTGMGVSTKRAVIMFLCFLVANGMGRCSDMINNLGLAFILILAQYPLVLFQSGFLLSFLAIVGLGIVYPVLKKWYGGKNPIIIGIISGGSIQIVTIPILAWFYYTYGWYSIIINIIIVPLVVFLLFSASIGGIFGIINTKIGIFFVGVGHYVLLIIEEVGIQFIQILGNKWVMGKPRLWQLILYYILIASLLIRVHYEAEKKNHDIEKSNNILLEESLVEENEKKEENNLSRWYNVLFYSIRSCLYRVQNSKKYIIKTVFFFAIYSVILATLLPISRNDLTITMLDVGQGESIHIKTKTGENILIDGGSTSVEDVGTYRIRPYLLSKKVGYIEYVIITHTDEDHISGIRELILELYPQIEIGMVLLPEIKCESKGYEEMLSICRENNIPVAYLKKGDSLKIDELNINCLHPKKGESYNDVNSYSVVLELTYKKFSMLFTGDLGIEEEDELEISDSSITVLKVGHHGSKNSTGQKLLKKINAKYAIISCGKGNLYGHPSKELLERLEEMDVQPYITMNDGAITIKTNGERIFIEKFIK